MQSVIAALSKDREVDLEQGWARGNLVLKVHGKIFAMLTRGRFVAKLPKARVDELVLSGAGARFDPRRNGRVMKEWFVAGSDRGWLALARDGLRFVKRIGK